MWHYASVRSRRSIVSGYRLLAPILRRSEPTKGYRSQKTKRPRMSSYSASPVLRRWPSSTRGSPARHSSPADGHREAPTTSRVLRRQRSCDRGAPEPAENDRRETTRDTTRRRSQAKDGVCTSSEGKNEGRTGQSC